MKVAVENITPFILELGGNDASIVCHDADLSGIGRNFGYEGVTQFQGYHSIAGAPGSLL